MRILHVEDDDTFRHWVKQGLKQSGFAVDGAGTAKEAMQMASENIYDVILLDIGMPELNGLWALRTLRQAGNTAAIFIISGQAEEQLKLDAFEGGADDYMTKPILVSELKARIHRWLQRRNQFVSSDSPSTKLTAGNVEVDLLKHQVTVNGRFVPATPKERMVLEYLIRHAGRVVTQTQLAQAVWDMDYETGTNVVEVHVSRLRKKIDEPGKPSMIQTIPGSGYMIEKDGA